MPQAQNLRKQLLEDFKEHIADPLKKYFQKLYASFKKTFELNAKYDEVPTPKSPPPSIVQFSNQEKAPELIVRGNWQELITSNKSSTGRDSSEEREMWL